MVVTPSCYPAPMEKDSYTEHLASGLPYAPHHRYSYRECGQSHQFARASTRGAVRRALLSDIPVTDR